MLRGKGPIESVASQAAQCSLRAGRNPGPNSSLRFTRIASASDNARILIAASSAIPGLALRAQSRGPAVQATRNGTTFDAGFSALTIPITCAPHAVIARFRSSRYSCL